MPGATCVVGVMIPTEGDFRGRFCEACQCFFHAECFKESNTGTWDPDSCGCQLRDDLEDGMGSSPRRKRLRSDALRGALQSTYALKWPLGFVYVCPNTYGLT